ncbi:uncharacterized protein LOC143634684 [Bidens hawaiensis]|uniref:uncharacterized protein LOC143634684 n=1 Tax=Bidens hawaiensis TaxID=980011 RepID=UPI0040498EE0
MGSTDDYLKIIDELIDLNNTSKDIVPGLLGYLKSIYQKDMDDKYAAPMLYIGMYIASASLVCILAMVADLLYGLHRRKLWFPCKFFRLNAAFLALISIAMKLPVDLSGSMPGTVDQAGKLGSMAFMCTMMANLLPCLASMDSDQLLSNVTALCILVVTMVVNVVIQIQTGVVSYGKDARIVTHIAPKYDQNSLSIIKHRNIIQAAIYVTFLLVLTMVHVCSCLAILRSKKIIESKYQEGHARALKEFQAPDNQASKEFQQATDDQASKEFQQATDKERMVKKLKKHVTSHWIMAGSGNPQFIAAYFRTTSASGVTCLLVTVSHTLTISWTFKDIFDKNSCQSDYAWSMIVILVVQYIGVVVGTIAPLSRCFATLSFKVSPEIISNHFKVFKVENHWTYKLHEWKRASIDLSFGSHKLKVVIDTLKRLILWFCIELQEGVVVVCNITTLFPFVFLICVWYCYQRLKWLKSVLIRSSEESSTDQGINSNSLEQINKKDLDQYVLHLEKKMELADRTLGGLFKSVNRVIKKGEKRPPQNLIALIEKKSTEHYLGVGKFDHSDHYVPSLRFKERYPETWSLPVVTLTAIAVSLQLNTAIAVSPEQNTAIAVSPEQNTAIAVSPEQSTAIAVSPEQSTAIAVSPEQSTATQKQDEVRSLLKSVREGIKYVTRVEESLNVGEDYVNIQKEAKNLWNEVDLYKTWLGHKLKGGCFEGKKGVEIVKWFMDKAKGIDKSDEGRYDNDHLHYKYICASSMYHITKTIMLNYPNIDEVSTQDLFDHLTSMIADIIAACLTNLPQAIIKKCHADAIEKREASVKDAARLLGRTKNLMEILAARDETPRDMDPSDDLPFIDKWRAHFKNPQVENV